MSEIRRVGEEAARKYGFQRVAICEIIAFIFILVFEAAR
jgi:hypothetical protein